MHRRRLILASAVALASCSSDSTAPLPRIVQVSPKSITMSSGQSVDIQVTISGFPIGTVFTCRVVPASAGTVTVDAAKCRLTVSTPAMPGTLMIAQVESVADTASIAVPAR